MAKKKKPAIQKQEIQQNADEHIDQDFPGFPHLPSTPQIITPLTAQEKKLAGSTKKRPKKTYG